MKNYSLMLIGLLLFSTTTLAVENADPKKVEEVHHRVQRVVPYALDRTLQTFTKTVHGGVQHVVIKSAEDSAQIKLIQEHLLKLANAFSKGDFSSSERVHGADMPGLVQLKTAQTDDIKFEYKDLPNGAQIHYSSEYPQFVQALHLWFDAQLRDHGSDVIPEHIKHHSTISE
ncbi:MAG: aspartate carbamoyltransferase [Methylobacter sp.]